MKIDTWLAAATKQLQAANIQTARLDSLILLGDKLQLDRSYLLAHPEAEIAPEHQQILETQLARRTKHEPLAYIRGFVEFYGRSFIVTPDVLVPRPESETIIEILKKQAPSGAHVADIGTGSGALAITAALETNAVVAAVDIDEACLAVAERNAVVHTASIQLLQGDLFEPFAQPDSFKPQILLANLPYVPNDYEINDAARHEPALALFAGTDGLDLYRRMFEQIGQLAIPPKLIITESLPQQHTELAKIAEASGYKLETAEGYIQAFRR